MPAVVGVLGDPQEIDITQVCFCLLRQPLQSSSTWRLCLMLAASCSQELVRNCGDGRNHALHTVLRAVQDHPSVPQCGRCVSACIKSGAVVCRESGPCRSGSRCLGLFSRQRCGQLMGSGSKPTTPSLARASVSASLQPPRSPQRQSRQLRQSSKGADCCCNHCTQFCGAEGGSQAAAGRGWMCQRWMRPISYLS